MASMLEHPKLTSIFVKEFGDKYDYKITKHGNDGLSSMDMRFHKYARAETIYNGELYTFYINYVGDYEIKGGDIYRHIKESIKNIEREGREEIFNKLKIKYGYYQSPASIEELFSWINLLGDSNTIKFQLEGIKSVNDIDSSKYYYTKITRESDSIMKIIISETDNPNK
jgi:hypothetical protein